MKHWFANLIVLGCTLAVGYAATDWYQRGYRIPPEPSFPIPTDPFVVLKVQKGEKETASAGITFEDVTKGRGLDFSYYDGAEGQYFIQETTGSGAAHLDYDNDGRLDLFLVNGTDLPLDPSDRAYTSQLFRQDDSAGYDEVSTAAGVDVVAYGQGAVSADFNDDGFADLCLTGFGSIHLLANNGDGTFSDISSSSNVETDRWATSAAFADLDRDGDQDLYVCTYANVDLENPHWCGFQGKRLHCHPQKYTPQPDLFFENLGNGAFRECSKQVGIVDEGGRGLGIAIADLTGDFVPDIFVANDTSEAFLFVNKGESGQLKFENEALQRGIALNGAGSTMAGMGVACADYDQNQWLDLFVTDYYEETNVLFQNLGDGQFVDSSGMSGLASPSRDRLGWGTVFLDADNDGWDDVAVANGHVSDFGDRPYAMAQQLFRQVEPGRFEDVSKHAGLFFQEPRHGRGLSMGDVNDDGLADVVVCCIRQPVALLLNRTEDPGNWIGLDLIGRFTSRDARNVRIELDVEGKKRIVETVAGTGYLSSNDKRVLVGLGSAEKVDQVKLIWPSGLEQTLTNLQSGRYYLVTESITDE